MKCFHSACEPNLFPLRGRTLMRMRKDKRGREISLPPQPPGLLSPGSDEVNGGVTVRPDAAVLIAVDRSSKQCLRAAESGGVSLWVKGRGFTQATLVDNPFSALKAGLCNLGC